MAQYLSSSSIAYANAWQSQALFIRKTHEGRYEYIQNWISMQKSFNNFARTLR